MKKSISIFLVSVLVLSAGVLLNACKLGSIDPEAVDVGYDYYPLEIGRYITYTEHDITYDPTQIIDTTYHVKELVYDSFIDGAQTKYIVYRFAKRTTDTDFPLQPDSVWTVVNTANQLVRTESNIEYIKLVFPVKEGKTWNGNAKNTSGEITSPDKYYKMTAVDRPATINNVVYPKTLKMTIANQEDPIVSKDIRFDIYAKGIGFIKKDYTLYYYKQGSGFPPQTIDFGYHKVMEITGYGKE